MSESNQAAFDKFARVADTLIDPSQVRVALDVGSRDVEVAMYLKGHYPNATVYAFECNPVAIELCRKRIGDRKDVILVEKAVSEVDGPLPFFAIDPEKTVTPHSDGNIGASSLYKANGEYPLETYVQCEIEVESVSLQSWAKSRGIGRVDVIWMDLQGAALRALKGLGSLLDSVGLIYTEVEYKPIYSGQALAGEVRAFLLEHGHHLCRRMNRWEWFGDELYCRHDLLPFWRRLLARIKR